MQIGTNTTSMEAGVCLAQDKDGRDYCVAVVKGTFTVGEDGTAALAEEQEPMVFADTHHGDPGETSIEYECEFARFKPRADLLVNGRAYSPSGRPVREMHVSLEFGSAKKTIRVVGDRQWQRGIIGVKPSPAAGFTEMPLVFERAFGGSDHSHPKEKYHGTELRNPVGVGFHRNSDPKSLEGKPLPNLEDPEDPYKKWSDTPAPFGFGVVGRNWQPRIHYAGTYDQTWMEQRGPLIAEDFDDQYFQAAPRDQQVPFMKGGELIRCVNMTPEENFIARIPKLEIPMVFRFWDRASEAQPHLDTVVVEPDRARLLLVWRACVALGRKIHALREVVIGPTTSPIPRSSKPQFKGIQQLVDWKKKQGLP